MTNPHFTLPLTGSLNSFSNFLNSNLQPQNTSQNQNQNQNNTNPLQNQSLTNQQNQPVVSMELRLGSLNYLQDPNNTTMPSLTQQPSDSIYTNNNFLNTNLNQLSNFSQLQKQPLINSTIQNNVPPPISTSTSTSTTQENPPKKKVQAYSNKAVRNFITEDITYKRKNNKKRITTKKIIGRNQYPDNQDIILENANNEVFITNNQPLEEPGLNLDLEEEIIEEAEEEETDEEDEFNWKSEEKKNRSLVTAVPVKRRSSRRNTKILEVKLDESSNSEEYYATDSEPEKEKSAISKTRPKTNQAQIQNQNQNLNQNQKLEEKETINLNNVNVLPTGNNSIQSEVNQQNSNYVDNVKIQENSGMVNNNTNNNNNMALENNEIYQYYNEPQTLPFFQKKLQKILTRRDPDDKDNNSRFLKSISQNTSAGKNNDDDNNNIKERKFLVKWRGVSYIHVEWVNEEELLKQHMGRSRVKKFNEKIFPEMLEEVKNEPFNTDFFEVDRILDLITLEKTQNYNGTWGWRVLPRTSIEQKEENENESQTTIEANIEIKTETETKKGTETQTKTKTETETETKTGTGTETGTGTKKKKKKWKI